MRKSVALSLVLVFCVAFASIGCDKAKDFHNVATVSTEEVVDYGNGVYYFPFVEADFGNGLSAFLREHPDLEVGAMAPSDRTAYGLTLGYFVTFRPKTAPPEKQ